MKTKTTRAQALTFVRRYGFAPLPVGYRWYAVAGVQHTWAHLPRFLVAGDAGLTGIVGVAK